MSVRAYECWVEGHEEYKSVINAATAGKARYMYLSSVQEAFGFEYVSFKHIKVKSLGAPQRTRGFDNSSEHIKRMYGKTFEPGQRVQFDYDKSQGVVVDLDGPYVVVVFDNGHRGNVHPGELEAV